MVGIALALGAITGPVLVQALTPRAGGYQGQTAQRRDLSFKVRDGKVRVFVTTVSVVCRISGTYRDTRRFVPPGAARIKEDGTFKRRVSPGDGTTYTYRGKFVSRGKATGSLSMFSTRIVFGGIEYCGTPGAVKWSATHR